MLGAGELAGSRREDHARSTLELPGELLQQHAAERERLRGERLASFIYQEIEDQAGCRGLLREFFDAAGGRMNALPERVKVQPGTVADNDFTIEHKLARWKLQQ